MAEAWAKHLWRDSDFRFYSAGIETHGMNPNAVQVMQEVGVDMQGQYSKTLDQLSGVNIDVVFTVCSHADETCPVLDMGTSKIHVGFDDPPKMAKSAPDPEAALDCYRQVRDQIKTFIENLPQTINQTATPQ